MSKVKSLITGVAVILLYYLNNAISAIIYPLVDTHISLINLIVVVVSILTIIELFAFRLFQFVDISRPSFKKICLYLLLTTVYAVVVVSVLKQNEVRGFSLFMFIAFVILAPVTEELLFRGIPLKIFQKGDVNKWVGILLSATLFGIVHMFPVNAMFFHSFIFGVILALLYLKERNIIYCIIIHGWYNLLVSFTPLLDVFRSFSNS